uniref:Uncharacterized protein n=1 Tax=Oryza punctata TaxID=4537 RepID=A0A0E0L7N8_ORYPU
MGNNSGAPGRSDTGATRAAKQAVPPPLFLSSPPPRHCMSSHRQSRAAARTAAAGLPLSLTRGQGGWVSMRPEGRSKAPVLMSRSGATEFGSGPPMAGSGAPTGGELGETYRWQRHGLGGAGTSGTAAALGLVMGSVGSGVPWPYPLSSRPEAMMARRCAIAKERWGRRALAGAGKTVAAGGCGPPVMEAGDGFLPSLARGTIAVRGQHRWCPLVMAGGRCGWRRQLREVDLADIMS